MLKFSPLLAICLIFACERSNTTEKSNSNVSFEAKKVGEIRDSRIGEISGIALSNQNTDVLWIHNDSGDDPRLYAIKKDGRLLSSIFIANAENLDWEDLASFQLRGKSFLLVADVGNNTVKREYFTLYIIEEPEFDTSSCDTAWTIQFSYPDGGRDCEAVVVDAPNGDVLLLSKRDVPAVLYQLPLEPQKRTVTANRLGELRTIPQPTPDEIESYLDQYHAQPTAMDMRQDGSQLAVLTYRRLFLFDLNHGESLMESLNKKPQQIEFPKLEQSESMCYLAENSLLITTEKLPAPIFEIHVKD